MDDGEFDAEVALKLDAASLRVFNCCVGVLERCVVLTGMLWRMVHTLALTSSCHASITTTLLHQ
jgi:hypothetical protein